MDIAQIASSVSGSSIRTDSAGPDACMICSDVINIIKFVYVSKDFTFISIYHFEFMQKA